MIRFSTHLYSSLIFYRDKHRASVGAIMGTCTKDSGACSRTRHSEPSSQEYVCDQDRSKLVNTLQIAKSGNIIKNPTEYRLLRRTSRSNSENSLLSNATAGEGTMSEHQSSENLTARLQAGHLYKNGNDADFYILRHRFLDCRRHDTPAPVLDCVA